MNRIRAAWIVLALLIAFAVFGHISVTSTIDAFTQKLWQAEQYALRQEYTQTGELLDELTELCETSEPLLTIFIKRDLVNNLRTNLNGLDAYLNTQYHNDLLMEIARAKTQVKALREQYFSFV